MIRRSLSLALFAVALLAGAFSMATANATVKTADRAEAEQYMDDLAVQLSEPGVWVDPEVTEIDAAEATSLDSAAKRAAAPMRIAVIPAEAIDVSGSPYSTTLAWEGEEIADQLYDRVGVEGVYAVMVDARDEYSGRGFHAVQRANEGPTYFVGKAVDESVDCCAPVYAGILTRFIEVAQTVDRPLYEDAAPWVGGAGSIVGLWFGGVALSARRRRRAEERDHLDVVRPLLNEEVIALSQQISTFPMTIDEQQATIGKDVLDTVEKARQRLDKAGGDADIQAVTTLLGAARYGIACLEALRNGRPQPRPTPPCFFDPRHGPSSGSGEWTPEGGVERSVEVCDACSARLAANQQPDVRTVRDRPYWQAGESISAYIEGYWTTGSQSWLFPDQDARRAGDAMRTRWAEDRPWARFTRGVSNAGDSLSTWASSSGSSSYDDDSSGGSRSSGGWSSRTSSSGGGSSSRSSHRSGGSRGF